MAKKTPTKVDDLLVQLKTLPIERQKTILAGLEEYIEANRVKEVNKTKETLSGLANFAYLKGCLKKAFAEFSAFPKEKESFEVKIRLTGSNPELLYDMDYLLSNFISNDFVMTIDKYPYADLKVEITDADKLTSKQQTVIRREIKDISKSICWDAWTNLFPNLKSNLEKIIERINETGKEMKVHLKARKLEIKDFDPNDLK